MGLMGVAVCCVSVPLFLSFFCYLSFALAHLYWCDALLVDACVLVPEEQAFWQGVPGVDGSERLVSFSLLLS